MGWPAMIEKVTIKPKDCRKMGTQESDSKLPIFWKKKYQEKDFSFSGECPSANWSPTNTLWVAVKCPLPMANNYKKCNIL